MTVRIATEEDFNIAYELAYKFSEQAYGKWLDPGTLMSLVIQLIQNPEKVFLLYEDKGFLAGTTHQFLLGPQKMAAELGWYVKPEARGEKVGKALIESFEDWAKIMGCSLITMISIDDAVGEAYKKNGYDLYERTYMKEL
jgi:GNAT superfamily N-acetyltransferase